MPGHGEIPSALTEFVFYSGTTQKQEEQEGGDHMEKQKGQLPGSKERQQPFQPERQGGQPGSGSKKQDRERDEREPDDFD